MLMKTIWPIIIKVKSIVTYWPINYYSHWRIKFIFCFMERSAMVLLRKDVIYTFSQCSNIQWFPLLSLCSSFFFFLQCQNGFWVFAALHLLGAGSFLDYRCIENDFFLWGSHLHMGHYLKRWLFLLWKMYNHGTSWQLRCQNWNGIIGTLVKIRQGKRAI